MEARRVRLDRECPIDQRLGSGVIPGFVRKPPQRVKSRRVFGITLQNLGENLARFFPAPGVVMAFGVGQ